MCKCEDKPCCGCHLEENTGPVEPDFDEEDDLDPFEEDEEEFGDDEDEFEEDEDFDEDFDDEEE